jgi:hypothetical protein
MLNQLLNFQGINWWTLLGGIGLNFCITVFTMFVGAYLNANEATSPFYNQFGPLLVVLFTFLVSVGAGWVTAKIADDVPIKHALWGSLGAFAPFIFGAVMFFNPTLLMLAVLGVAGNLNGGILAAPKPRARFPRS